MKVVWTDAALADLDDILAFTAANYPTLVNSVERRIRAVVERLGSWPASARIVDERPDVRVVPLIRYPYRVFYRINRDRVEILHIHHAAREPWAG
jgi:toxin ParE1/3/4